MFKRRIKSVLERNVSFFILLGSSIYIIKGNSIFLTGYLEDHPSRRLSSSKHLSMCLTLSTEWSESQLSALCFSSPSAQIIFFGALIISCTCVFSVLYGFLSCHLFHRPFSHLKNATQCFPSTGFCLTHRHALIPTWHWQILLTCCNFLHPSPLSDLCSSSSSLVWGSPCRPSYWGPLWWSIATFASTFPNHCLSLFLLLISLSFLIIYFACMVQFKISGTAGVTNNSVLKW